MEMRFRALRQRIDGKPVPTVDMQSNSRILVDGFRHCKEAGLIAPNPGRKGMPGDETGFANDVE